MLSSCHSGKREALIRNPKKKESDPADKINIRWDKNNR